MKNDIKLSNYPTIQPSNYRTIRIAVAGKGGTGKTTFCALLIKELLSKNKTPILAVDADPNSNLGDLLGIKYNTTIADIREEVRDVSMIPAGMAKSDYIDMRLNEIVVEGKGVDLIVMGRPEGRECYCYVNELLRGFLSKISSQYAVVVIDNEAGMEHLSRRTTDDIDTLFIVSELTKSSIVTVSRTISIIKNAKLKIKNVHLVLNKIVQEGKDLRNYLDLLVPELKSVFVLPYEKLIFTASELGESILNSDKKFILSKVVGEILNAVLELN